MQNENLNQPSEKKEVESTEFVYLELDRKREFKFGMKGLKKLEGEFPTEDPETHEKKPTPFLELFTLFSQKFRAAQLTIDELVTIIWAGLIRDDPDLTKEQTLELLDSSRYDFAHIDELITNIFSGFAASTPEGKDEKKSQGVTRTTVGKRGKKRRGTGNKSSK